MADKEWSAETVFDLFGDEHARHILVLASQKPMSADEIAEHLDVSLPTVYRRVDTLSDYSLLEEGMSVTEDGNHYTTYETTLRQVTFEIDSGGYNIDIEMRRHLVDQFEAFWEDLDRTSPDLGRESSARPDNDSPHGGQDG